MNGKPYDMILLAVVALTTCTSVLGATKTVAVKIHVDSEAYNYAGIQAMDGNPSTMWHTEFSGSSPAPPHEIVVDLGAEYELSGIAYLPRPAAGNGTIKDYEIYVSSDAKQFGKPVVKGTFAKEDKEQQVDFPAKAKGRYLRLVALNEAADQAWTSIAELRLLSEGVVFRADSSTVFGLSRPYESPVSEMEMQYETLLMDLSNRSHFARVAPEAFRAEATILVSDRDPLDIVLRRTASLLAHLSQMPSAPDTKAMAGQLDQLQASADQTDIEDADTRFTLFEKVCNLRRKVAFSNPLLNFDKLVFIKRHRAGFNHMCDQYYGINAKPGGSLFVLENPFSEEPAARDILADSVVERGRLKGKSLAGGSFVAPDLSYDGKQVMFAYVECQGDRAHRHHTDPSRGHWDEGWSYHLFKVNIDGSGLEQLTDGTWNDFDPCWLPNGRVALITERRGGYLRCGRTCPTYTLFDMEPDGSDIRCLSFHETNEWHPSVTHDGRIIYTRWDYVDRHGCTAHLPWITSLDGRDSRAVHGNFAPRGSRPDMELDVRAIPGSNKYIATAAPHHGQAFGSIVVVDPRIVDDDRMAPVKRFTPEIGFPESQGGAQVYGTPWPLSEDFSLCVYDTTMKPNMGGQGGADLRGNYGIYLVDSFGNKELIYRDPEIACQSPMPLRSRPLQPLIPTRVDVVTNKDRDLGRPSTEAEKQLEATVAVVDVYDSLRPWPDNTRITSLRVIQVLPMTVPSGGPPHETRIRMPSAGDSVVLARNVLGTVPVEADGSAHFVVPAHKEILFQAVDQRGLAVQSMRSATYLQAGEHLACQGCHEEKHRAARLATDVPLALRRPPSRLQADVEGSNPFSYPRLVQPVLDRKCADCHAKHADKTFVLSKEPLQNKFYASYVNLAPNYGFQAYGESHRTMPGHFGAYGSKLLKVLDAGHYDVKLTEEEMHRLTLWLDCCSMFYGVYEAEAGQAQLRGEVVLPTLQ
ncbi:MAG TPA: discoidin domain-containing protein [Thermoguttaceae bacterium]|nr:discoidin domain-containing protein [Thermoguttaceae bacterium]